MSQEERGRGLLWTPRQGDTRFGRAVTCVGCVCAALFACLVLGQNAALLAQRPARLLWVALGMALLAAGAWGLSRLPSAARWDKLLLAATLGLCLALRLGWVLAVRTPPQSDFSLMYQAAQRAAAGDFSWTGPEGSYFWWWSYQIPFVLYQSAVWRLIPSIWALKAMNLVFMVGIDGLIYAIARRFLPPRAALVPALLYAVYPAAIHTGAVLTNQHISTFFLLLGLWLLLAGTRWWQMALAGASLAVGDLMRPEAVVFLAAAVCCGACLLLRFPRREVLRRVAAGLLAALAAYGAVSWAVPAALTASGAAPYGVTNRVPEWKFVLGLDATGNGGYSEDNAYILDIRDDEVRKAETREIIARSFRECESVPGFFLKKTRVMWASEESFYWSTGFLDPQGEKFGLTVSRILQLLETAEKVCYLTVWLCVPVTALLLCRRRTEEESGGAFFCLMAVCAAFCVYLLIEVQPRYRYFVMPLLFLLSGPPALLLQKAGRGRKEREKEV